MKNYLFSFFFLLSFGLGASCFAQAPSINAPSSNTINDLVIYPNPVNNGRIYITTHQNLTKNVEIYDVLGKKILSNSIFGKELNISRLAPGIYILKINEGNASATRKLVVR